ncbi:hypothetical protein GCM10028809_65900 [Spirosoma gilvum]
MQVSPNGARAAAPGDVITLPGGDLGILNYAFVLEQLEATFYQLVLSNPYQGMTAMEMQLFQDLRNHEVTHRAFYRTALGGAGIPDLTFDFSSINFRQRTDVLEASRMFAEVGTAAYTGGGKYLTDPENLKVAGKIVSLEARHVSIIREMEYMNQTAFSGDNIVMDGLFMKMEPSEVLPKAQKYILEKIDGRNLPTAVS